MPGFESRASCIQDKLANHYTLLAGFQKRVIIQNRFYILNLNEFYALNYYFGKSSDHIYLTQFDQKWLIGLYGQKSIAKPHIWTGFQGSVYIK